MTRTADGLYDPRNEHDACGVALVAKLDNVPTREIVSMALLALDNMEHRGAEGADARTGDGAGILMQMPDAFLRGVAGVELPASGSYAVAMCFLPQDAERSAAIESFLEQTVVAEGQSVLGWRDVPVVPEEVGDTANESRPVFKQLFIGASAELAGDQEAFERKLYVIRRIAELEFGKDLYVASCSSRTLNYKGMLISGQLPKFFPDLADERVASAVCLVHSRFSTNTFPSWDLSHPFRVIAHNGEINTLRGNINWMRARESQLASHLFGDDLAKITPVVRPDGSDSATFDNVLELLMLSGRKLPHAVMMMVPEAYERRTDLPEELQGFYAFHSSIMEPWDGPAAVCFTDGRVVGATLDRNGLRPGRWVETHDGIVVLGSETGLLPEITTDRVKRLGRLQPGKLFLIDLEGGRIIEDEEVKRTIATAQPYAQWVAEHDVKLADLPPAPAPTPTLPVRQRQLAFGYTQEDERIIIAPMAAKGEEPIGSMGNDTALAVMSDKAPPLYTYFKQLFAQVTNPPIDPIREEVVMSLTAMLGSEGNLLDEDPEHAHLLRLQQPILRNDELAQVRDIAHGGLSARTLDATFPAADGVDGLEKRLEELFIEADEALADGATILILSDRGVSAERAPVPALLVGSGVHHHLVRAGTRLQCGLVIETGEPREVHHMAVLLGFGVNAINPYLLLDTVDELLAQRRIAGDLDSDAAQKNVVKAIGKGLMKTISKIGIATIQSYTGAQIFEAIGLSQELVDRYLTGVASRLDGIGLDVVAAETLERHAQAFPTLEGDILPVGGKYYWRRDGEAHAWRPETISLLQHAVRGQGGDPQATYDEFAREVNEEANRAGFLRGLLNFRADVEPIDISEVESAKEIVKRFATGAMSLGSISRESHENLAIALNRLGGKSNTGEGGEDPVRFKPEANGDSRRSAIKQIASGRFGVTIEYLVNADQLQIKMAQGAKPGEGGQLPGHKVDDYIGRIRHSTPGVGLISPPPHHDIYSIEDLKQLIYDLRCANPGASVSVKLVSEVGVGTVAAGVAKANADHVLIAGHDGGTGASPLSSVYSAGVPWEIGLAETQQTLLKNDLRRRITVQTDGQLKTGRDVAVAAILGADEFGFSTAPLIASGCIMMRACHLNTCPVGIATQDPVLRARFRGQPEYVVNYFFFVAEELRAIMASLGIRTVNELIGRTELLQPDDAIEHWKARGLKLAPLLAFPTDVDPSAPRHRLEPPPPVLGDHVDWSLVERAQDAINAAKPVVLEQPIRNLDRCTGGILSSHVAQRYGQAGLPDNTIQVNFSGSAGQSFGGWLAHGVTFSLEGDANDYVGKGLSGGVLSVRPPADAGYVPEDNVIVGNTLLYGATEGRAFFRGRAGERFAVRNSGASAVVEGVGDHGCEYMTGGRVVVIGPTGRNFAAGMSGGLAFVWNPEGAFDSRINPTMLDQLEELTAEDQEELRALLEEHVQRTGSTVAEGILTRFDEAVSEFVKIFPTDFKRVLAERAAAAGTTGGAA